MKKSLVYLTTLAMMLSMTGCATSTGSKEPASGTYTVTQSAYLGDIVMDVTFEGEKITDIKIVSDNESSVVANRAYPIIIDRILEAQTPVVDSVSGASFLSTAVKKGVAEAGQQNGIEYGDITFATKAPEEAPVTLEDVNTDIVIVGGGPSGLAAAITAKETNPNVDVIVVEKLDILSGNGKFDLNFYDVFNSEAQKAAGVEDSIEQFMEDQKDAGNTPERLQVWAEGESEIDAWLRSFGVELNHYYGKRNHMVDKDTYAGEAIQDGMEERAAELGIEIRTGTKGTDLVFDENNNVVGVSVEHKHESYNIMAQSVIVATGGFSSSKELLAEYAPGYEVLGTTNQLGTTGDFVNVFEENNFGMDRMDLIRVIPSVIMPSRDITNSGAGSILVNANGERFVNERLGGLEMGTAILDQGEAWMIVDSKKVEDNANVRKQVKLNKWVQADTIEELAEKIGVNAENLVATIEKYNANAESKTEDEFGHTPERAYLPEGPYYASKSESAINMTKGGVTCNENAQVLYEDGTVVNGLYASGEVTWQSGGYSQSVVFGRIAGEQAAKNITK